MSSSAQQDKSPRQWLSDIPALLTAAGVVLYGMLNTAYSLFYGRIGVNPEDVGLGYAATISRSTGFVVIVVCVSALVLLPALWAYILNRQWRRIAEEGAEVNRRAAQVILEQAGGAQALKEAAKSDEASADYLLEAVGQHMAAAREAEASRERPRHSQRLPLLAILILLLVLMPLAPLLAYPRANEVRRGQEVSPVRVFGITVLAVRASHAAVRATGKPGETVAIDYLRSRDLLYLGRTDGTIVLYDSRSDEVIHVPASLIVLQIES
jgi:hypothetical protein